MGKLISVEMAEYRDRHGQLFECADAETSFDNWIERVAHLEAMLEGARYLVEKATPAAVHKLDADWPAICLMLRRQLGMPDAESPAETSAP